MKTVIHPGVIYWCGVSGNKVELCILILAMTEAARPDTEIESCQFRKGTDQVEVKVFLVFPWISSYSCFSLDFQGFSMDFKLFWVPGPPVIFFDFPRVFIDFHWISMIFLGF